MITNFEKRKLRKQAYIRINANWNAFEENYKNISNKELASAIINTKLNKRFLENAPFSKFYLEEDNLSPGRIGSWIGWKIVNSYMKHNDVSLQKLMKLDAESLLINSKHKPKR